MVLADLINIAEPDPRRQGTHVNVQPPVSRSLSPAMIARVEDSSPDFVVHFTGDKNGFYINGRKYSPSDPPMTTVSIGHFIAGE